eukprot:scaffold3793_cov32-Phaeocystis_antarctica.AAC.1
MDTGRGVQYEGEGRQVERTGTSVPARASAAVVSKLPEREGVASIFSIHGSSCARLGGDILVGVGFGSGGRTGANTGLRCDWACGAMHWIG